MGGSGSEAEQDVARMRQRIAELEEALAASERKRQALEQSELRLRRMFEGSDDGGWDWDIPSGNAYLSPGWFRVLGYEEHELPSTVDTWLSSMHPDDAPSVNEKLTAYLEGRAPSYEAMARMKHKSGRWVWVRNRGKVFVRDDAGRPVRMAGTITDVSQRKEAEEKLHRGQTLLYALMDHSPALIYVKDLEGRFTLVNQKTAAFFKLEREQITGKADHELLPPETVAAFRKNDARVLDAGEPISVEEVGVDDAARRTFLSIKFPLHDEDGKIFAIGAISTDITDRKRAEEERAALRERVIDAQRMALRELSTPLIPIADDVVVMPLVGAIDSQRAQQVMEVLLQGVQAHQASAVIIDVTGVQIVDTQVANALVQASRAVKLLGADVVLTGIRPEVARTLVNMGADLGAIVTQSNLRSGIAHALRNNRSTRR